jgi:hypothetical protein
MGKNTNEMANGHQPSFTDKNETGIQMGQKENFGKFRGCCARFSILQQFYLSETECQSFVCQK